MKKIFLSLGFITSLFTLSAQVQGPNNPSFASEQMAGCLACVGTDWTSFTPVYANDNVNATVNLVANPSCFQSSCYYSKDLYASHFGFTIPPSSTIDGILVEVKKNSGASTASFPLRDSVISLITSAGILVGQNKSSSVPWPTVSAYTSYGGNTDLWGHAWTATEIDSSEFGLDLKVVNTVNSQQIANVDHIRISVFYTNSLGIAEMQSSEPQARIFPNPATDVITLYSNKDIISKASVMDVLGNEVMNIDCRTKTNLLKTDISKLAKGVYFLQFTTSNETKAFRLVKE
ncbi:MAG: T9SS type A sorting domain-containing protein [Bacteroidota bacterium]